MALGKNVRALRLARGWDLEDLSKQSGVKVGTISAIEQRNSVRSQFAPQLAVAFGIPLEQLIAETDPMQITASGGDMLPAGRTEGSNVVPAAIGTRRVPLISYVQAGCWTEATDPATVGDGFEYLLTDLELSGSAFALEIQGESMLPEFRPGDRVIVDPEIQPHPGDCVVAMNGGQEATFKKYRPRGIDERGDTVFELVPLNEDFAPMRSDQVHIRIVGTMMEHRKYRRRS